MTDNYGKTALNLIHNECHNTQTTALPQQTIQKEHTAMSIIEAIENGKKHEKKVRQKLKQHIEECNKTIPSDIAFVISTFAHPLEITITFRIEMETDFQFPVIPIHQTQIAATIEWVDIDTTDDL